MVASGERPLKMLVVHARGGGFYVALVPAELSPEQVETALNELGVDAGAVLELSDWRTSADSVAVAYVPPLEENRVVASSSSAVDAIRIADYVRLWRRWVRSGLDGYELGFCRMTAGYRRATY